MSGGAIYLDDPAKTTHRFIFGGLNVGAQAGGGVAGLVGYMR